MKIVTVIGARPQFIKAAPVTRALKGRAEEILVHTGQHYDANMSRVFFEELEIPEPAHNLGAGSGTHAEQTAQMLTGLEALLLDIKPDWVLIYGDTNSTLAGALAASKLHIPIAHVEAGLRSFNRRMPEEINRVVADHLATLLFCPTDTSVENLKREGITKGVRRVGDVMHDSLLQNLKIAEKKSNALNQLGLQPGGYALLTLHRAENTDDPETFRRLMAAVLEISKDVKLVWPVHPRTRKNLASHPVQSERILLTDPVSYLDMIQLEKNARTILTDSGGVQKEAYWLGVPCITLREETEWVETLADGRNMIAGTRTDRIVDAFRKTISGTTKSAVTVGAPTGADEAIVRALLEGL